MLLTEGGHDAVHVIDLDLHGAPDDAIMRAAVDGDRVLISADTDFGELLAATADRFPSVVLLRRHGHEPAEQARAIAAAVELASDDISSGAIVVVTDSRVRIRRLPILGKDG